MVWFGLVWFGLGWVGLGWVGAAAGSAEEVSRAHARRKAQHHSVGAFEGRQRRGVSEELRGEVQGREWMQGVNPRGGCKGGGGEGALWASALPPASTPSLSMISIRSPRTSSASAASAAHAASAAASATAAGVAARMARSSEALWPSPRCEETASSGPLTWGTYRVYAAHLACIHATHLARCVPSAQTIHRPTAVCTLCPGRARAVPRPCLDQAVPRPCLEQAVLRRAQGCLDCDQTVPKPCSDLA